MKGHNTMTDSTILTDFAPWNPASRKPKASGKYLIWTNDGSMMVADYSVKYDGWGILPDGGRTYEIKDVEFWMSVLPPTIF